MSNSEKEVILSLTEAVAALPENKREFILGYAEGVLAMAAQRQAEQDSAWACRRRRRGGERIDLIYLWMDKFFDPLPKELKDDPSYPGEMFYYQSQDESYKRYKHLQYRNLILEALLSFFIGLFLAHVLKI